MYEVIHECNFIYINDKHTSRRVYIVKCTGITNMHSYIWETIMRDRGSTTKSWYNNRIVPIGLYAIGLYKLVTIWGFLRVLRGIYVWGLGAKPQLWKMGVRGAKPPHEDYVIQLNCLQSNCLRFNCCNFLLQFFIVDPGTKDSFRRGDKHKSKRE